MDAYFSSEERRKRAEQRLARMSGEFWQVVVRGTKWRMYAYHTVSREASPPEVLLTEQDADYQFLLHCRDDLAYLLENQLWEAENLRRIRQRLEEATPGVWDSYIEGRDGFAFDSMIQITCEQPFILVEFNCGVQNADLEFIDDCHHLLRELLGVPSGRT